MDVSFALRVLRADLGNFFLWQHRGVQAYLVTGKNSGTHWVKYMLSCAIAHEYGVPAPMHASGRDGDAIIGHPRWKPVHPHLPRIGSSHSIPSGAFALRLPPFRPAPVVVLVRDIRQALLSNYVKWRDQYGVDFPTYLAGDPSGRRYVADIWWYIHFFNRWGDVARTWPELVSIVRYEDIRRDPASWLRRIAAHWHVPLSEAAIAAALPFTDRAALQAQLDPEYGETIVPDAGERLSIGFSAADEAWFCAVTGRYLRHRFGYDYPSPRAQPLGEFVST